MLCCAERRKNPLRTNEEHGSIAVGVEESKTATTMQQVVNTSTQHTPPRCILTLLGVVMPRSVRIAPFAAVSPTSDALVTVSFARVPATYSCLGRGRPASADGMGATSAPSSCGAQSLTTTPPDTWSREIASGTGMCSECDHAPQHGDEEVSMWPDSINQHVSTRSEIHQMGVSTTQPSVHTTPL